MATITVLKIINTAPAAGLNKIHCRYNIPATNVSATAL